MSFGEARSSPPTLEPGQQHVTQALPTGPTGQGLNESCAAGRGELEKCSGVSLALQRGQQHQGHRRGPVPAGWQCRHDMVGLPGEATRIFHARLCDLRQGAYPPWNQGRMASHSFISPVFSPSFLPSSLFSIF